MLPMPALGFSELITSKVPTDLEGQNSRDVENQDDNTESQDGRAVELPVASVHNARTVAHLSHSSVLDAAAGAALVGALESARALHMCAFRNARPRWRLFLHCKSP